MNKEQMIDIIVDEIMNNPSGEMEETIREILEKHLPEIEEQKYITNKEIQDIWDWSRYEAGNFEILIDLLYEKGLLKDSPQ